MLNIVIFGAPGSGKGTQSDKLIDHYKLFHISTGDVLRDNIRRGTELGKTAKGYIDQGQLVPDELIINMLEKKVDEIVAKASKYVVGQDEKLRKLVFRLVNNLENANNPQQFIFNLAFVIDLALSNMKLITASAVRALS